MGFFVYSYYVLKTIKYFFLFFRCLHKTGGSLQFSPEKCVKIIGACFRLHNNALEDRLPLVVDGQIPILDNNHTVDAINNINQAHAIRQGLIQRFYKG